MTTNNEREKGGKEGKSQQEEQEDAKEGPTVIRR
jgi:hypothetical protein